MKNILIADDNKVFRDTLASYLRSQLTDYTVQTVEDGAEAIEALESNPVSMVLTDLMMPKVDGYKVIAYLKKKHPSLPVIIMTSAWSLELEMLIRKMGIVQYLEKPFHHEDLDRMVIEPLREAKKAATISAAAD